MVARKIAAKQWSLEFDDLPPEIDAHTFPHGDYIRDKKIKESKYEDHLEALQVELVKLQRWVRENNERVVMVFEGRDAAGKGGTIRRFQLNLNPRAARTVALSKPSDVERGQWYFQRYIDHLPTEGEMVFYDRSWYNRAGVERVFGFCSEDQVQDFFMEAPVFEGMLEREGIHLFKFWLTVERPEQLKRFYERKTNPLKQWKLSPIDTKSVRKWDAYTRAITDMFRNTDTDHAPWTVLDANDQKRARLNAIRIVLNAFEYDGKDAANIGDVDEDLVWTGQGFLDFKGW
ncbi:polyphosphate kinase 2 [Anderseniella sp. Alg231-50]|uniref:polyphosphate kinase 2 n=1 Tax=Anderseniella sp. Alg231-50 TaxID=1922226 RepID=UPI000D55E938